MCARACARACACIGEVEGAGGGRGRIPHPKEQPSNTSWMRSILTLYPETVSDPTGSGLSLTRLSPPLLPPRTPARPFRRQSKAQVVTCVSAQPAIEFPMTPWLSSIHLPKQLTELRETLYLLDHGFIIKGYNSGRARGKSCTGQGVGKGTSMSSPS